MDTALKISTIAKHYNLSLRELADKAGIGRGAIQAYTRINAQKSPAKVPLDVAVSICNAFPNISRAWFFFDEGEMITESGGGTEEQMDFREKYYKVLEKYSSIQEDLIDCLKGHPEGLPPLRPAGLGLG
jgi:transcriptional regulator with XRE-family HTH domain